MSPPVKPEPTLSPEDIARIHSNIDAMRAAKAPDSDIERYLQEVEHLTPAGAAPPHPKLGHAAGMLSGAAQGATFGFADEALGGIDALNKSLPKMLGGEGAPLSKIPENYRHTRDVIRASDADYAHDNPLKHGGAALAGGLATSLGGGGAAMLRGAPGAVAKAGSALEQGAAAGALSGLGASSGSAPEQIDDAVRGAMVGAPLAAAGSLVSSLAGNTGKYALNRLNLRPSEPVKIGPIRLPINTVDEEAAGRVTKALAAANMSPDDAAAIAAANRLGAKKPQTLMEIGGQRVAREARTARAASPAAGQAIDAMLETRTAGAPDRAIQDALETSGLQQRSSSFQTTKQLIKERAAEADKNYAPVFKDQTPISDPRIQEILDTPAGQQAWKRAQRMMANDRVKVPTTTQVVQREAPDLYQPSDPTAPRNTIGVPQEQQSPTIQQLHYLKLALDDLKQPGLDRGEGAGGLGYNEGRSIHGLQKDLLAVMDEVSPSYANARQQYAQKSALKNANEVGAKLFSMKPEEAADEMASLGSTAEKDVFRRAGMDALADRLENGPADVEKGVSKPRDLRRIRLLFPDDQSFQQFKDRIAKEAEMVGNQRYVSGGSQTADKLMDLADMLGVAPLAKAATGNFAGAAKAAIGGLAKIRTKAYGSDLSDAMTPFVTAGGNGDANELKDAIQKLRTLNAPKPTRGPVGSRAIANVLAPLPNQRRQ